MKYYDATKRLRQKWFRVVSNDADSRSKMLAICRLSESDGHFYHYHQDNEWWFEKEEDAIWFALIK